MPCHNRRTFAARSTPMNFQHALQTLTRVDESRWAAWIDDSWLQGRSIFGGLQAALGLAAIRALLPAAPPLRTVQTTFIAPVPAGEVVIEARLLRAGRSAIHVEARLYDGDQIACLIVAVLGEARPSSIAITLPPVIARRPSERSMELPFVPGVSPAFLQQLRMRWADGGFPFCGGTEARTQVWVEVRESVEIDEAVLLALADSIPSPALSLLKRPVPASSMTWTLELLRAHQNCPALPWLMDARVDAASDGYGAQTATLCDHEGRPVALSRQSIVVFG